MCVRVCTGKAGGSKKLGNQCRACLGEGGNAGDSKPLENNCRACLCVWGEGLLTTKRWKTIAAHICLRGGGAGDSKKLGKRCRHVNNQYMACKNYRHMPTQKCIRTMDPTFVSKHVALTCVLQAAAKSWKRNSQNALMNHRGERYKKTCGTSSG